MIANMSPADYNYDESLTTLRFFIYFFATKQCADMQAMQN